MTTKNSPTTGKPEPSQSGVSLLEQQLDEFLNVVAKDLKKVCEGKAGIDNCELKILNNDNIINSLMKVVDKLEKINKIIVKPTEETGTVVSLTPVVKDAISNIQGFALNKSKG